MYSCETLFPAHNQITITKNPSAAEGRHNHTFFELDCVKVGRCLAELGGHSFFLPADSFAFLPPDTAHCSLSFPAFFRLRALFWQKMQLSEQPEKNTVPEPFKPDMHGSSQIWSDARPIFSAAVCPHMPGLFVLSAPHFRGQSVQFSYMLK